jgi:hypothetical protein
MELRFVKGDFEHGKFKLQQRQEVQPYMQAVEWQDVPCVELNPEKEWCEHLVKNDKRLFWVFDFTGGKEEHCNKWNADLYRFQFCPICGKEKP